MMFLQLYKMIRVGIKGWEGRREGRGRKGRGKEGWKGRGGQGKGSEGK